MKRIDQVKGTFDEAKDKRNASPSDATVKRLPRYHRYLGRLLAEGTLRISSSALASRMGITASQIRQDLSCFGDFGQQGYGYNVRYLYHKISRIMGMQAGHRAVFIGFSPAAEALATSPVFVRGDVEAVAIFAEHVVKGSRIPYYPITEMPRMLEELGATLAVFSESTADDGAVLGTLAAAGVRGVLNYTTKDLTPPAGADMKMKNVYLDDPCLVLCYRIGKTEEHED